MNVAVMKTKAESAFAETFEAVAGKLPGGPAVGDIRRSAITRFATLGLPHRRVEEWKYTDLRAALKEAYAPRVVAAPAIDSIILDSALGAELTAIDCVRLVFANGVFSEALSRFDDARGTAYHFDTLAHGLKSGGFGWLRDHLAGRDGAKQEAVVALNTAFATDGALLRVSAGAKLARPIHLVFIADETEKQGAFTRNFVEIGAGADALIIESHIGRGSAARQSNTVLELAVKDGARVCLHKQVAEGPRAAHVGTLIADLGADVDFATFQYTAGTALVRNQQFVTFAGPRSKIDLSGCFLGRGTDHIDNTLVVDHAVPHCTSRELFKGVLDDEARGVFQGKVIVRPDAQKTDGKQMAQVLMLSPAAEFDSKPELEIYADDVVCGHGSTAAQLDDDLLFYCRSRGIPESQARAMLIRSFIGEAIDRIEHDGLRAAVEASATRWLADTPSARSR